jgi:hypothetical protein
MVACGACAAAGDAGDWIPQRQQLLVYESAGLTAAFHPGLSKAGLVERQSYTIAFRWADARNKRLSSHCRGESGYDVNPDCLFDGGRPSQQLGSARQSVNFA